jgi:hypothetical protein
MRPLFRQLKELMRIYMVLEAMYIQKPGALAFIRLQEAVGPYKFIHRAGKYFDIQTVSHYFPML